MEKLEKAHIVYAAKEAYTSYDIVYIPCYIRFNVHRGGVTGNASNKVT